MWTALRAVLRTYVMKAAAWLIGRSDTLLAATAAQAALALSTGQAPAPLLAALAAEAPGLSFPSPKVQSATGLEFSATTREAIDRALAAVPAEHGSALLEASNRAVQAIVAVKKPTTIGGARVEWTIAGYVGYRYHGTLDTGVSMAASW